MKPTTTLVRLGLCLSTISSTTFAWPTWLPDLDTLVVRQDADPQEPQPTPSASSDKGKATTTGGSNTLDRNTASVVTDEDGKTVAPTKSGSPGGNKEEFDPTNPPGAVVMITPAPILGQQVYKVGDMITWKWNYTNLLAEPSAIDVILSCSVKTQTWTLTSNMTFETEAAFTWDSKKEKDNVQSPLLTAEYTLIIKDSDDEVTATAEAGYLAVASQFIFGMYIGKGNTPLSEWHCATCSNAALSNLERNALGFALIMSSITVLSFTWFVSGVRL